MMNGYVEEKIATDSSSVLMQTALKAKSGKEEDARRSPEDDEKTTVKGGSGKNDTNVSNSSIKGPRKAPVTGGTGVAGGSGGSGSPG